MTTYATQHAFDSYEAAVEGFFERGWTDGLPIVPPTPAAVERFLAAAELDAEAVLGHVPTREVTVSAEDAAINAVMAGCRPEYMPVVVAAVRALLHEEAIAHSTTATLAGAFQVVIVNGSIRNRLGIACEQGCFGPGWRANATIGRAVRLVVRNVLKSVPGGLDRALFSHPARYSFCFGENEEETPWTPLHVERGCAPGSSAVTVHSSWGIEVVKPRSLVPETILDEVVHTARFDTSLWVHQMGEPTDIVIVFAKEHVMRLVDGGWDKARIREYLWKALLATPGPDGERVRLGRAEGLLIVAAGGPAQDFSVILPPHVGLAVTEPIAGSPTE
jgi:hypothetical protein